MNRILIVACGLLLGVFVLGRGGTSALPQGQEGQAQTKPATRRTAAPPTEFTKYHFVLLRTADDPPRLEPAELGRLMSEHLGHLTKVFEEGHCFVAGPFSNRFDEKWRGMCLYDGDLTAQQVREMAEADPSVQAGLMAVEIMDLYTAKDALAFPLFEQEEARQADGD